MLTAARSYTRVLVHKVVTRMSMKVLFPSKILASYVEAYYISSDLGQDFRKKLFPAVSTSYIKLAPASAIVSGPASEPMLADTEFGAVAGLGVKLRAGAFYVLFGIPACELTNRVIKLDDILGNAAAEIIEQMAGEVTPSAKAQCFERTLVRFAQRVSEGDFLIERHAVTLLRRRPTMPKMNPSSHRRGIGKCPIHSIQAMI